MKSVDFGKRIRSYSKATAWIQLQWKFFFVIGKLNQEVWKCNLRKCLAINHECVFLKWWHVFYCKTLIGCFVAWTVYISHGRNYNHVYTWWYCQRCFPWFCWQARSSRPELTRIGSARFTWPWLRNRAMSKSQHLVRTVDCFSPIHASVVKENLNPHINIFFILKFNFIIEVNHWKFDQKNEKAAA